MTTRVEQLSDGEELVTNGPDSPSDNEMDPRDRILGHRRVTLAAEPGNLLSREGSTRSLVRRDA
jgi:hypothetical protein